MQKPMQFKKEKLQHIPNTTCPECHHTNTILKDHHHAEQVCEQCGAILNPTEKRETQKGKRRPGRQWKTQQETYPQ